MLDREPTLRSRAVTVSVSMPVVVDFPRWPMQQPVSQQTVMATAHQGVHHDRNGNREVDTDSEHNLSIRDLAVVAQSHIFGDFRQRRRASDVLDISDERTFTPEAGG